MARRLAVEVHPDEVRVVGRFAGSPVAHMCHVVQRRTAIVGAGHGVQGPPKRYPPARLCKLGSFCHLGFAEEVQGPKLVIVAPAAPVAELLEGTVELFIANAEFRAQVRS